MEPGCPPWLLRFDRPCRLLLHALASGPAGALAALRMLQREQPLEGPGQAFPWQALTAALCAEEPVLEGPQGVLAVKPRLLLLPIMCQRNFFSLLLVTRDAVPGGCLGQLLQAIEQDSHVDPWMRTLGGLLQQGPRAEECFPSPTPLSSACQQQLRCLCQKIAQSKPEGQKKWNWCFRNQPDATGDVADSVPQGGKCKKVSEEGVELVSDREKKRLLLDKVAFDPLGPQECGDVRGIEEEVPQEPSVATCAESTDGAIPDSSQQDAVGELRKVAQTELAADVKSFLQVHGQKLKMLLLQESSHSELSIPPELCILNNCSPRQLSVCPEPFLGHFCRWLLALTPDLSYTSAAVLAEQLFLRRVLSLTQPPSRHLMAALSSFCSKYSQPFCHVVVAAVLQEPREGAEQTKLVCDLVEDCLEPRCVQLVLSQVLELPLSEKLLLVVQAVLERQKVLPPELLDLLVLTLCQQASAFATSLDYAKLVTAMLTMYQNQITPAHRSSLAAALDQNNAALKKSLQAVLEGAK
ncbi:Fanconi anemia group E protein isoform X3 [Myiozetetes cayanensis]|uniref:Fanconi anemia group E protein isoform X3 n=1 Tax=Myiozetetes cayanensis TaxID=478635 RepID=UPI00215E73B6|nr:Fanconi anemia group E protein isoform X3 [Myiozetetes cayanensis]